MIAIKKFKLTAISPLMQSNPQSMESSGPTDDGKIRVNKKTVYDDKHEAEIRCYQQDGKFVHPSMSFRAGLLKAGSGKKFGKLFATSLVESGVHVHNEFEEILDLKGKPVKAYEIDKRSVIVGKARVMRCRPKFREWTMVVELEIDDEYIALDQVVDLLNVMGSKVGLGEYRPERDSAKGLKGSGNYGRFRAELA